MIYWGEFFLAFALESEVVKFDEIDKVFLEEKTISLINKLTEDFFSEFD